MAEPEMMETVGDVLNAAADLIEKRGWGQGSYSGVAGCLCVAGALNVAVSGSTGAFKMTEGGIEAWDGAFTGVQFMADQNPIQWNDLPSRTKPEVLRTLRLAAWVYDDQPLPIPVVRHG